MQPISPCLAPTHWWRKEVSVPLLHLCLLLQLGTYSVFFCFPSWLCCPLRFQNFLQTCLWEDFLLCGNFSSFTSPSLGRISIPKSSVSAFVFYILSYLLLKRLSCFSRCLVSFTSFQKLFFGSCSKFKWSFNEFVVEKVVSPSYTSSILEESQHTFHLVCFPGGSDSKESAWNAGELGSLGWEDPLEVGMAIHSSIIAWRICRDRGTLAGYSFRDHKKSDMTEQLSTTHLVF